MPRHTRQGERSNKSYQQTSAKEQTEEKKLMSIFMEISCSTGEAGGDFSRNASTIREHCSVCGDWKQKKSEAKQAAGGRAHEALGKHKKHFGLSIWFRFFHSLLPTERGSVPGSRSMRQAVRVFEAPRQLHSDDEKKWNLWDFSAL